ncbi:MAG: HEXXH motif-containing putative peptide modification protein [Actinomycetota bacterium]|nr:HEXXH motif-containing putative peptide modification protein [Actinomycetota bacterium]
MFVEENEEPYPELIAQFRDDESRTGVGTSPQPVPLQERDRVRALIEEGYEFLHGYHKGYAATVDELVVLVLIGTGNRVVNASVSGQIGTIFINPQPGWMALDYADALLHEAIHEAQYLDQMIQSWYSQPSDDPSDPDALVISPIRRVPRPISRTLQAATVAVPLVDLLWTAGARERATEMCRVLVDSLNGIKAREHRLSRRGSEVLEDLAGILRDSPAFAAMA